MRNRFKSAAPFLNHAAAAWSWWIAELGGMLPKGVRSAILPGVDRLYLIPDGQAMAASRRRGEAVERIGSFPLTSQSPASGSVQELVNLAGRSHEVVLCLPADKVLIRPVTLPRAAEENLYEVLGFEMDRHTPFPAAQVYYDYVLTARNPRKNDLTVDLVVTPRGYLDTLLATLRDMGLRPHQVTLCRDDSVQPLSVNLLPAGDRRGRPDSARYLNYALGALALLLLVGAVVLPLGNKLHVIRTLEARIELAAGKAEITRRLDEEVRRLQADSRFLTEKKLATPLVLEILNELTNIVPDDTWLNRLAISAREVQLQGQSTAAAALIPLVESSRYLEDPRFSSPVTRAAQSNLESFILSADVAGGSAP